MCFVLKWFKATFYTLHHRKVKVCVRVVAVCFSDLQACVLSSVELQVLTSSCFKLRTVHNIPVTSNKDGKKHSRTIPCFFFSSYVWMLCAFLLLSPFFSQSQTHSLPLLLPLLSAFSLKSNTKAPVTLSAQKSHIMREGALQERI